MKKKVWVFLTALLLTAVLGTVLVIPAMAEETPQYVAQIGETKYESLKKAVEEAQNGDEIKMIADHEITIAAETDLTTGADNKKRTVRPL